MLDNRMISAKFEPAWVVDPMESLTLQIQAKTFQMHLVGSSPDVWCRVCETQYHVWRTQLLEFEDLGLLYNPTWKYPKFLY